MHVAMLLLHAGSDFDIQVYNFVPLHPFKKHISMFSYSIFSEYLKCDYFS